jgi:hypothetical protein
MDVIQKNEINERKKAQQPEDKNTGKKPKQVKYSKQEKAPQQLHIIDGTYHFEIIITGLLEIQVYGFGKMKPVGDDNFGILILYLNHNRFTIQQRINLFIIHYHPYRQEAEKDLVATGNDDIMMRGDTLSGF